MTSSASYAIFGAMVAVTGLVGLRPAPSLASRVTSPPYDVLKDGSPLLERLRKISESMVHVILGEQPKEALDRLVESGALIADNEPAYYVYEQVTSDRTRSGVFVAAEVSEYSKRQVIRHEKTFDEKVKGRIALANSTGHTIGPVFCLTRAKLSAAIAEAKSHEPLYSFTSELGAGTDLDGIRNRIWRVSAASELGQSFAASLASEPFYIADGHHRYHAALRNGQSHLLVYVTEEARILAYDRVVNPVVPFSTARQKLDLQPTSDLHTPNKHQFCLYTREGSYLLGAQTIPEDVVGRLDCAILERELYPALGLTHDHIVDPAFFDYYPESALDEMKAAVDDGRYEMAIALHPVSIAELVAVADAGLDDSNIVMPEKSTFFSPKILTGLFLYRHSR